MAERREEQPSLFDVFRGVVGHHTGSPSLRVHPFFSGFGVGFPVDTVEDKSGFTVKADLPGVTKDKLKINYQDRWLAIESERPCDTEDSSAFVERPCGIFQRHIRLPVAVRPETINAKLQDGVLTVRMTKEKPGDPVTVPIS